MKIYAIKYANKAKIVTIPKFRRSVINKYHIRSLLPKNADIFDILAIDPDEIKQVIKARRSEIKGAIHSAFLLMRKVITTVRTGIRSNLTILHRSILKASFQ